MADNTVFRNKKSIDLYESQNNCEIHIHEHATKPNIFLFSHSEDPKAPAQGLVSKASIEHLENGGSWDDLEVANCDYINDSGKPATCLMIIKQAVSNCGKLRFSHKRN